MTQDAIKTGRLSLRLLQASDAPWITREIANPNVHRWLTSPPVPYRHEDAQRFLSGVAGTPGYRAIERAGQPMGVISIGGADGSGVDLGYWLQQSAWGQGIMSEAARAMVDWHWSRSSEPLASGWIVGNQGSSQILTQLGFTPTGQAQGHVHFFGEARRLERVVLAAPHRPLFTRKTPRLVLNALTMDDLPVVHAEWGAPEIARMTSTVSPNWTLDQARAWLGARTVAGEAGFGRAVRLRGGRLVGSVGMGGTPLNLGYMFGTPHWGQGYATEALRAFLPAALAHRPDIEAVEAHVFDDNPASARVLAKLGFTFAGPGHTDSLARVEPAAASRYRLGANQLKA